MFFACGNHSQVLPEHVRFLNQVESAFGAEDAVDQVTRQECVALENDIAQLRDDSVTGAHVPRDVLAVPEGLNPRRASHPQPSAPLSLRAGLS